MSFSLKFIIQKTSKIRYSYVFIKLLRNDKVLNLKDNFSRYDSWLKYFFTSCSRFSLYDKEIKKSIEIIDGNNRFCFHLNVNEYTQCGYYFKNNNPHLFNIFKKFKDGVFVDVGANVGYFSLLASSYFKKVISFEPDPLTFLDLNKNISISKVKNIIAFENALSDKNCSSILYRNPINRGGSSMEKFSSEIDFGKKKISEVKIEVKCLDEIYSSLKLDEKIKLIKIDVEGHELNVIKGAMKVISLCKPVIFAEVSSQKQFLDLLSFLPPEYKGYSPYNLHSIIDPFSCSEWNLDDVVFSTSKI